jgi:hypothetical protein
MLRYNLRYYAEFPWDPLAERGHGIHDCLRWLQDDLMQFVMQLAPEPDTQETARELAELVSRLLILLPLGHDLNRHQRSGGDDAPNASDVARLRRQLAARVRAVVSAYPRLVPWYQLGRAVGECYLECLIKDCPPHLRNLTVVVKAARRLPERRVQRIQVLRRLASVDERSLDVKPATALRDICGDWSEKPATAYRFPVFAQRKQAKQADLPKRKRRRSSDASPRIEPSRAYSLGSKRLHPNHGIDTRSSYLRGFVFRYDPRASQQRFDEAFPGTALLCRIESLDKKIRTALDAEPDPPTLVITFDDGAGTANALLNGEPFPVSYNRGLILQEIYQAEGRTVSGPNMVKKHGRLKSANIYREVNKLPKNLRALIGSSGAHHGGYRWLG